MPRTRQAYPPEFRRQIVELARAGRSPEELAHEFEPTAQTIRNWIKQADLPAPVPQAQVDEGRRRDGLTTAERQELLVCGERTGGSALNGKSWQKPRPACTCGAGTGGSHGRPARSRPNLRVRES